jgi:heme exporter protein B
VIASLIARDVRRSIGGAAWLPVGFFLVVATLVPFAVGPDPRLLERIASGGLWIAALTAALLPIERLVEPDRANGFLDQLTIHGVSEEAVGAAKVTAHWLTFGPLLLIAALPSSFILGIAPAALGRTMIALAVGTPGLAALAVMVAALTAGLPRAGALAGVLLLPLAVPLLIFGAGATGDEASGALLLEAAVSLLLVAASPFVIGAAIRAART